MFDRFKNVMKGMVEKGISKAETPEILAEKIQIELESDQKKLREAVTSGLTNEKLLEQQLKKHQEELAKYEKNATIAVEKGDDALAKQYLEKKRDSNTTLQTVTAQLEEQRRATVALKERLKEVEEKLQEFLRNKNTLLARAQAGEAVAKANEMLSGAGGNSMDKWEQKIREKEAHGAALGELGNRVSDAALAKKAEESALDDQLAVLKAQMGATPRLVVVNDDTPQRNAQGEVVDENLPMVVDVEEVKKDDDKKDSDK